MVFATDMNQPWVYMCPPSHPSGSSQCVSPEHTVSCIEPGLAICFTYDDIHVSMLCSQIIPHSPSPTESKRLFFTSVSLLPSHIWGYRYHLSNNNATFYIYLQSLYPLVWMDNFTVNYDLIWPSIFKLFGVFDKPLPNQILNGIFLTSN